jgi:hypothetical protein
LSPSGIHGDHLNEGNTAPTRRRAGSCWSLTAGFGNPGEPVMGRPATGCWTEGSRATGVLGEVVASCSRRLLMARLSDPDHLTANVGVLPTAEPRSRLADQLSRRSAKLGKAIASWRHPATAGAGRPVVALLPGRRSDGRVPHAPTTVSARSRCLFRPRGASAAAASERSGANLPLMRCENDERSH